MQWNKVKSILIVLLLLVNVFLASNTAFRYFYERSGRLEIRQNVVSVLAEKNITCGEKLLTRRSVRPLTYEVDRDRQKESDFAHAVLSGTVAEKEYEDGSSVFKSGRDEICWLANGSIKGRLSMPPGTFPKTEAEASEYARQLLARGGMVIPDRRISTVKDGGNYSIKIICEIDKISVFNCGLTVILKSDETIEISGKLNLGSVYEIQTKNERFSSEEDIVLSIAKQMPGITHIETASVTYFMSEMAGGKSRFIPAWRIETNLGEFCVDASKKTLLKAPKNVGSDEKNF